MEYRLGLYEKALPKGLSWEAMLNEARDAGFDYLEISIDETDERLSRLKWSKDERLQLKQAIEKSGLPIRTMCLSGHRRFPIGSHDPAVRERSMEIMRDAIDFAEEIGIRIIQLAGYDVYYEESDETTRKYFIDNLHLAAEYAAIHGVTMGFETMEVPFMNTVGKAMHYVDIVNSPYLGVYPDLGNLTNGSFTDGIDLYEDISSGKGHMFAMHLKDTKENIFRDLKFGDGRVDFVPGIRRALDCGIRMFVAEFWHHPGEDYKEMLKYSCGFVRERINKALSE